MGPGVRKLCWGWGLAKKLCGQKCGQNYVFSEGMAELSQKTLDNGGGCEIRTHGEVAPSLVFKTSAIDHSANPPTPTIIH